MSRSSLQANYDWEVNARLPWNHLSINHEMRCWHQKKFVWKHCYEWWNNLIPRNSREIEQGSDPIGSINHEDQSSGPKIKKVLGLDRWFNLILIVDFPDNVDFKGRVPREWFSNCAQKMFLMIVKEFINIKIYLFMERYKCQWFLKLNNKGGHI